jgi:hypothetical protein
VKAGAVGPVGPGNLESDQSVIGDAESRKGDTGLMIVLGAALIALQLRRAQNGAKAMRIGY